jgi:hypothetical protein
MGMSMQIGLEIIKNMDFGRMMENCPKNRNGNLWHKSDFDCFAGSYQSNRIIITSQFAEYLLENVAE